MQPLSAIWAVTAPPAVTKTQAATPTEASFREQVIYHCADLLVVGSLLWSARRAQIHVARGARYNPRTSEIRPLLKALWIGHASSVRLTQC